jgi:hypothetical protein
MSPEKEAEIIGKYLSGRKINSQAKELYINAVESNSFKYSRKDLKIQAFFARFPFMIGMLDGGSALVFRQSVLRKKIFLMLAILETIPEYASIYFCRRQSVLFLVKYFFTGLRGVVRGVCGAVLVKVL